MKSKINFFYCCFFIILLNIFLGAISSNLIFLSLLISCFFAIIIGNHFASKPSHNVCVGVIILLVFQNFCIGIGAHLAWNTSASLKFLTQIPFLSIAIIWGILQIVCLKNKKFKYDNSKKSFLFLILCIIFSLFVGRGSLQSILMNVRNLTTFFMAYQIGEHNLYDNIELNLFLKKFLNISLIIFIIGIILLLLGYDGYSIIGIKEVYIAKGSPILGDGLDSRFYTTLISKQYTRMGSLYYEPVNLAYFYALSFIISLFGNLYTKKFNKILMIIVNGLGLLLTFGKGGYLIVASLLLCLLVQKILQIVMFRVSKKTVYKITIILVVFCVSTFCILYFKKIGAAVSPHFWGVIRTWKSVKNRPYGYGLGTGGNMAQIFNSNASSWYDTGGETALMSYMYQIGIQGVFALILCMYFISINKNFSKLNKFERIFSFVPLILIGVSLLQDNTFAPQCIVPFMLVQGGVKYNFINSNVYKTSKEEAII